MDVAYSRVMLLGTAGVGKTSFKRSLMKEQWNPSSLNSTIVSNIHPVKPVQHQWQRPGRDGDDGWREVTEDDEIQEMAELFAAVHKKPSDIDELDSKLKAISLFQDEDELPSTYEVSKETVQKIGRMPHIQSFLSKAVERAKSILSTSNDITPQPFVHIWDCGGQPVFLEVLPAFLTSRTMFVLLYDASKSLHEKRKSVQTYHGEIKEENEVNMTTLDLIRSWLSNIHIHLAKKDSQGAHLSYPKVLCVGTHGDKVKENPTIKKNELESQCKGEPFEALIEDYYIVDNTTAGEVNEDPNFSIIRKKICDFTSDKLTVKTPISWVLFRKVIGAYHESVITLEQAIAIGMVCKIPAKVVPMVLRFYHDLGVLLFYPHIEGLKDKVIIDSKWFVNALGKVLTLEGREEYQRRGMWTMLREKGILTQPLYVAAWREVKSITPEAFIELLVHFRLAAEINLEDGYHDPDSKLYFLPLVLPTYVQRELVVHKGYRQMATPLHLTFRTKFVPPGFFTRLITSFTESPRCKIQSEKKPYRNRIQILYGDFPCDSVILMELTHAIQVEVIRYRPDDGVIPKFSENCQMLLNDIVKLAKDVDSCLFNRNSEKCQVFSKPQFICTSCLPRFSHYLYHDKQQTNESYFNCEKSEEYRLLTPEEKLWFPKARKSNEVSVYLTDEREMYFISEKIEAEVLPRLAALLNMTSNLRKIQADQSKNGMAAFNLLYEWTQADGKRNDLVDVFKQLKLNHLAKMVQKSEYVSEQLQDESNKESLSFSTSQTTSTTIPKNVQLECISEKEELDDYVDLSHLTITSMHGIPNEPQSHGRTRASTELSLKPEIELISSAKCIKQEDVSKLIDILDGNGALGLRSIHFDDLEVTVYYILLTWLQADPRNTKKELHDILKALELDAAAKK